MMDMELGAELNPKQFQCRPVLMYQNASCIEAGFSLNQHDDKKIEPNWELWFEDLNQIRLGLDGVQK